MLEEVQREQQEQDREVVSLDEIEERLELINNHLQTVLSALDRLPITSPIEQSEYKEPIEEKLRSIIISFELRQAVNTTTASPVVVLNQKSGRETQTTMYNGFTDEKGTKHGFVRIGRGVKEIYFSKLLNRWVFLD